MSDTTNSTGEWGSAHSPVVVGVDGSEGSRHALAWAAAEAARSGADLRLVMVVGDHPLTPRFPVRISDHRAESLLKELAAELADGVPVEQISTETYAGHPDHALLDHLGSARMLVVGRRGLGAIPRLLVGSTSLAVAGRSPVPVAVVPRDWSQATHAKDPIVLGLDPYRPHHRLLHLAFRRAEELGVPLVAVHGWEGAGVPVWSDSPVDEWEREAHAQFAKVLEPWRERFPEVEVVPVPSSHHPATAVLDQAEKGAQLVVLGRHATNRLSGFAFGSVTRAVLHYAHVPVLVVPTDED